MTSLDTTRCSRMDKFQVKIRNTGEVYLCSAGENLLRGMELLGRRGIPVGCRGGGCGVCKVRIERGRVKIGKMSREHISEKEVKEGVVLACRAHPLTTIELRAIGKLAICVERTLARSFVDGFVERVRVTNRIE